ncbi:hypothetical protein FHS89_001107 [Rubricella aquisinus]|uniref:Uncharacterized protein n=1 Tax=Rubricella aquisinus TaxID=2028108 RepID=A0A840X346_9RHOB|nr:hypothetical protein [Rubricella aquisinus]MBB5515097.1 hypothetical protein [Rubricella aquisinus]
MRLLQNLLRVTAITLPLALAGCAPSYVLNPPSSAQELGAIIDTEFGGDVMAFEGASLARPSFDYIVAGRVDLIEEMLRRGWNPDDDDLYDWLTPSVLQALHENQPAIADALIRSGYTVKRAMQMCATGARTHCEGPLETAVLRDSPEMVDLALRYNAIFYTDDSGRYYSGQDALARTARIAVQFDHPAFLTALARAGYDTGPVLAQEQNSGGGGGGSAVMGIFGSLAGSALGSAIGGSEGDIFASTLTGIVDGANSGNALTGTMSAIGQGSGLMDSSTAGMIGVAGSLFGGGAAATQSGAIQRPGAVQREVATPIQTAGTPSNYSFTCPMGSGPHNIPIPASSNPQCISAMRTFAFAATCNLVDEMGPAQDAYYSQCAAEIYQ